VFNVFARAFRTMTGTKLAPTFGATPFDASASDD
jgi:hypothetical protein